MCKKLRYIYFNDFLNFDSDYLCLLKEVYLVIAKQNTRISDKKNK